MLKVTVRRAPRCHKTPRPRVRIRCRAARRVIAMCSHDFQIFCRVDVLNLSGRIAAWHSPCTRADRSEAAGLRGPSSYMK